MRQYSLLKVSMQYPNSQLEYRYLTFCKFLLQLISNVEGMATLPNYTSPTTKMTMMMIGRDQSQRRTRNTFSSPSEALRRRRRRRFPLHLQRKKERERDWFPFDASRTLSSLQRSSNSFGHAVYRTLYIRH